MAGGRCLGTSGGFAGSTVEREIHMSGGLTLRTFTAPQRRLQPPLDVAAMEEGWTWPPTSVTPITGER